MRGAVTHLHIKVNGIVHRLQYDGTHDELMKLLESLGVDLLPSQTGTAEDNFFRIRPRQQPQPAFI